MLVVSLSRWGRNDILSIRIHPWQEPVCIVGCVCGLCEDNHYKQWGHIYHVVYVVPQTYTTRPGVGGPGILGTWYMWSRGIWGHGICCPVLVYQMSPYKIALKILSRIKILSPYTMSGVSCPHWGTIFTIIRDKIYQKT